MNRPIVSLLLAALCSLPIAPAHAARTPITNGGSAYPFTAADSTNVSADSTNWAEQNGVSSFVRIFSNAFHDSHGAIADVQWKVGTFDDDQYAEITIVGNSGPSDIDRVGVNCRNNGGASGSNTMYRVLYEDDGSPRVSVYEVVNGNNSNAGTQLGSDISVSFAPGDKLSIECLDNGANVDIHVYKDTGGGPTLVDTRSDTSGVITGGNPGVSAANVNGAVLSGDDFIGGDVTAGGGGGVLVNPISGKGGAAAQPVVQ